MTPLILDTLWEAHSKAHWPNRSATPEMSKDQKTVPGFRTQPWTRFACNTSSPNNSLTPGRIERPTPTLGQDNREIYGRLLGLSEGEIRSLKEERII